MNTIGWVLAMSLKREYQGTNKSFARPLVITHTETVDLYLLPFDEDISITLMF